MRIHRSLALCAAVLATACGAPDDTQTARERADDSAAVEAVREPNAIDNVNQRLDQAQKDADARTAEGMEQVREAEGAQNP